MRTLVVVLMGLALVTASAQAVSDEADKIDKLIQQLGADSFAAREAATKALEKIGSPALEALLKASKSKDAEVRKRAAELASKIGRLVESEGILKPKLIELSYKDTPLKDALKDFCKKSGYELALVDPQEKLKDKKVTLETGKVTFWEALKQFCTAAGLQEADQVGESIMRPLPAVGPKAVAVPIRAPAVAPPLPPLPPPVPLPAAAPPKAKDVPPKPPAAPANADTAPAKPAPANTDPKDAKEKKEQAEVKEVQKRVAVAVTALQPVPAVPGAMPPKPVPPKMAVAIAQQALVEGLAAVEGPIVLTPGEDKRPSDTSTSVRVRVADRQRFQIATAEREVSVPLEIAIEPHMMLQNVLSIQVDEAIDEQNQQLRQVPHDAPSEGGTRGLMLLPGGGIMLPGWAGPQGAAIWVPPTNHRLRIYSGVKFTQGEKTAKQLKRLKGTVSAQVLGAKEEMLVVEKPYDSVGKSVTGKTSGELRIVEATTAKDGTKTLTIELDVPNGVVVETSYQLGEVKARPANARPAAQGGAVLLPAVMPGANRKWYTPWGLTLQDDKGNILLASIRPGPRTGVGNKHEYLATYDPQQGEPAKLVFTARRLATVQVPFQLENVDLK